MELRDDEVGGGRGSAGERCLLGWWFVACVRTVLVNCSIIVRTSIPAIVWLCVPKLLSLAIKFFLCHLLFRLPFGTFQRLGLGGVVLCFF